MAYFWIKTLISALVIAAVSEVARRSAVLGALLVSLPLTSILAFLWLYRDTHDALAVAKLADEILWMVFPSLLLFIVFPLLLRKQVPFIPALLMACLATMAAYGLVLWGLSRLGSK